MIESAKALRDMHFTLAACFKQRLEWSAYRTTFGIYKKNPVLFHPAIKSTISCDYLIMSRRTPY